MKEQARATECENCGREIDPGLHLDVALHLRSCIANLREDLAQAHEAYDRMAAHAGDAQSKLAQAEARIDLLETAINSTDRENADRLQAAEARAEELTKLYASARQKYADALSENAALRLERDAALHALHSHADQQITTWVRLLNASTPTTNLVEGAKYLAALPATEKK